MSATTRAIIASREGELRTVTNDEADRLMTAGGWIVVCRESDDLATFTPPKRRGRRTRAERLAHQHASRTQQDAALTSQEARLLAGFRRSKNRDDEDDDTPQTAPQQSDTLRTLHQRIARLAAEYPTAITVLDMLASRYCYDLDRGGRL